MSPQDIQNALKGPLAANVGNRLTPELVAGLLASLTESVVKTLAQPVVNKTADQHNGDDNGN